MIREEAKDEIYSYVHMEDIDSVHEFMDILFNDIESRICKNCKYAKPTEYDALYCSLIEISGCSFVDNDWYCKEFERKLESK